MEAVLPGSQKGSTEGFSQKVLAKLRQQKKERTSQVFFGGKSPSRRIWSKTRIDLGREGPFGEPTVRAKPFAKRRGFGPTTQGLPSREERSAIRKRSSTKFIRRWKCTCCPGRRPTGGGTACRALRKLLSGAGERKRSQGQGGKKKQCCQKRNCWRLDSWWGITGARREAKCTPTPSPE